MVRSSFTTMRPTRSTGSRSVLPTNDALFPAAQILTLQGMNSSPSCAPLHRRFSPRIRMPSESDAEVQSRLQGSSILEPAFPNHYVRNRNDGRQSRELDNRSRILNRPFLLFWQRHPRTALRRG